MDYMTVVKRVDLMDQWSVVLSDILWVDLKVETRDIWRGKGLDEM